MCHSFEGIAKCEKQYDISDTKINVFVIKKDVTVQ